MKTLISMVALVALMFVSSGCKTTTGGGSSVITPERVAIVAEFAAFEGTTIWLAKHPEDKPKFQAALAGLDLLVKGSNATPADVRAVFASLPIKELQGSEGAVYIGGAVILYDSLVRENVNIDANVWLRPVIVGLHRGLTSAL